MATLSTLPQRENLETFTLVWLDKLVNISQENIDTKLLLRKSVNHLRTFEESDKCATYIEHAGEERIVLIVSGRLGQEIVPRIHQIPQLIAVYVYCFDKKRNEEWARNFIKVKGVIINLNKLISRILSDQTKRNDYAIDEPLSLSFFHTKPKSNEDFSVQNDTFIHLQLLIDCLSRIRSNADDKKDLISLCTDEYKEDKTELNMVREFERNYSADRAIWWLTRECFLSRMLTKALQDVDIDLLYYFHFFIRDIRQQLEEHKCSSVLRTYRSQLMSKEDIRLLKYSIGEFLSINTFLSTIPNRQRALAMLEKSDVSTDFQRVLFEIDADPQMNNVKAFSEITSLNYFTGTEVIFFMSGTIFHPTDIYEENDILVIQMNVCSDNDPKMKTALENMKTECYPGETNPLSFGHILLKMKKFDQAEKYYHRILKNMPNDHQSVARCYQGLGNVAMEKHDYDSCLQWYQKALDTNQLVLRSEDPEIAGGYSIIANVYVKKGAFHEAIQFYTQALQIWIRALGKDHLKVATCYKNIACTCQMDERYSEALEYFQKALTIRERSVSTGQLDVAQLHNSIADVYACLSESNKALKHYSSAMIIFTRIYSSKHPEILSTIRKMGVIHEALGHFDQALAYFEKVALKRHRLLSTEHCDVRQIEQDIQRVSSHLHQKNQSSVDL